MARNSSRVQTRPRRERSRATTVRRDDSRDVRTAILDATETVLAERPLDEITVFDVIAAGGVSRATFYLYFESKNAAVATLAEEVIERIYAELWEPFITGAEPPSEALLTKHFLETMVLWREHRAVLMAAAGAWRADPDAFYQWGALWTRLVNDTTAYIERARDAGIAPSELNAGELAAMLVWLDETAFYLALTGGSPQLHDDQRLCETIAGVWMRSIYGTAPFK
jgi:AcrR family transcriptional regulator